MLKLDLTICCFFCLTIPLHAQTQHELNLMSKWSSAHQHAAAAAEMPPFQITSGQHPDHPFGHHQFEPVSTATTAPTPSEFVRFVRNVQPVATERHVVFADDYSAHQQRQQQQQLPTDHRNLIMRPPLDYLTYAGKRWILDPTQFLEPNPGAIAAPPAPSPSSPARQRSSFSDPYAAAPWQHGSRPADDACTFSGRRDQRHELLATLQTVEPLLRQRARMEEAPQTMRAAVYPKAETYAVVEVPVPVREAVSMEPLYESILQKVEQDKVIIEDIVEPKLSEAVANDKVELRAVTTVTAAAKPPVALSNIEDVLYGEKIEPAPLQSPDDPIDIVASGNGNVPPTQAPLLDIHTVGHEVYNYQSNEPVYSDAEYAKQYEYQEYDQNVYAENHGDTNSASDPTSHLAAAAVPFEEHQSYSGTDAYDPSAAGQLQQQQPIYQEGIDQYGAAVAAGQPPIDQSAQLQHQQQPIYQDNTDHQYAAGEHQYATDTTAADPGQHATDQSAPLQQPQPIYQASHDPYGADEQTGGQQPITGDQLYAPDYGQPSSHEQQQPLAYAADAQYAAEPAEQSAADPQQYAPAQPQAESYDRQYQQSDQQHYDQQYYAPQPAEPEATDDTLPYDPNAEYQVADDGGGTDPSINPADAYYAAPPAVDPYYVDQQQDYGAQQQQDVQRTDPAPNYVTSETDDSGGAVGSGQLTEGRAQPDDSSLAGNTESDFDFSVK